MTHIGIAIDKNTNDIGLATDNNLAMVSSALAVGQHVRQRLMTFEEEWFLDTTAGLPWIGTLLGVNYDPALTDAIVKAEILDTNGITDITSFSVSYNREVRNLIIRNVTVGTIYDEAVTV